MALVGLVEAPTLAENPLVETESLLPTFGDSPNASQVLVEFVNSVAAACLLRLVPAVERSMKLLPDFAGPSLETYDAQ